MFCLWPLHDANLYFSTMTVDQQNTLFWCATNVLQPNSKWDDSRRKQSLKKLAKNSTSKFHHYIIKIWLATLREMWTKRANYIGPTLNSAERRTLNRLPPTTLKRTSNAALGHSSHGIHQIGWPILTLAGLSNFTSYQVAMWERFFLLNSFFICY